MKKRAATILASIVLTPMLAACSVADGGGTHAVTDSIVFVSDRDLRSQLYIMRGDGSQLRQLTNVSGVKDHPSFSPDGTRIAFELADTVHLGAVQLYVINSDGTGLKQLTFGIDADRYPAWSPDGTRIVFASTREHNGLDIFTMTSDGNDVHNINVEQAIDFAPTWSTAANEILFASVGLGVGEPAIYSVSPTGDGKHLVIDGSNPQWSPTGSRFAFNCQLHLCVARDPAATITDTLAIDLDGVGEVSTPRWSPDESRIAFVMHNEDSGKYEIWSAGVDGSEPVSLTSGTGANAWSPDWTRE